jgi:hypothetical protein
LNISNNEKKAYNIKEKNSRCGTFSYRGIEYKLRHLAGMRVTVGIIPGKKLLVIKDGQRAAEFPL